MKRKVGKVYDKKGQDVFVDFSGLSAEEIPEIATAIIIENDELLKKKKELKEEIFNLSFRKGFGQLENPKLIGNNKKTIAKINTIVREREIKKA